METNVWWSQREGKFKQRDKTEIIVWWNIGDESANKEVKWRPLYGGAQGGGGEASLKK